MNTTSDLAVMLLIAVVFWGYGRTIQRVLAPAIPTDPGTAACVGLAAYLAVCGFIELTASGSPALFIGVMAFGATLAVVSLALRANRAGWGINSPPPLVGLSREADQGWGVREPSASHPDAHGTRLGHGQRGHGWSLILPLLLVLYLAFLINVAWWHFLTGDDTEGYLVLPLRILQTGSTGADPFLFRRIEAGLGGSSYLYALPLSLADFPAARIADLGLGSLLLALLVAGHARQTAIANNKILAASLAVVLVVVVFAPTVNLTPDLPAVAILYAAIRLARRLSNKPAIQLGEHVLFGLLVFALVCLRTTYLVPAFAVAASLYLAMLWTRRSARVVLAAVVAFVVVAASAVPWMMVLQRIAGTPYYPLLGFGTMTHAEVAGFTALPTLLKTVGRILLCYALALLGLTSVTRARPAARSELFLCVLVPLLLLLTLLAQTKYTVFGWRYGYIAAVTLPLFLFVQQLRAPTVPSWHRKLLPACLGMFAIALVRHEGWHPDTVVSGQLYVWATGRPYSIFPSLTDATADRQGLRTTLRAMQDTVPPGRVFLVRLDLPFLLDFRRNPVWVMDHPGLCGPPPGVPQSATVAAWTRYLRSAGVAFVAYAYGNEAGEPAQGDAMFLRINGPSYFQQRLAAEAAEVQTVLQKLHATAPAIYDDGTRYVVPLGDRAAAQGTGIAPVKRSAGS